ncbi:MAG: transposase [Clostridiales bacterium]|nr:transposase [Clostridiales bacterium]
MSVIKGNIRSNHIHVLVKTQGHMSPSRTVQYLKERTAHALLKEFSELRKKYWGCHL